tara:strand:- start:148 stop:1413 length:1266 start_codon:yes stop_codon:yes gene_type:complete
MESIFIQIPSYRDPELLPTIKDILSTAIHPERLTFGICHQFHPDDAWDTLEEYKDDPRFRIISIPWDESRGLCWARHLIQKLWKGEKWTLQLDSHHRMSKGWDQALIYMANQTEVSKPLLTTYAGLYNPETNIKEGDIPYKMSAMKFMDYGGIVFAPTEIENWQQLKKPIPARFVSGHFYFTLGIHCKEYTYDPNLYFQGDEISLSLRSYTLGYDLFHPHRCVVWHEYTRKSRTKHWDDFKTPEKNKLQTTWLDIDKKSKSRLRQLLQTEDNGYTLYPHDLGRIKSLKEYEDYAGVDFKLKRLHLDTLDGKNPPTVTNKNDTWRTEIYKKFTGTVYWTEEYPKIKASLGCTCNIQFIMVALEDATGKTLFRQDLSEQEYLNGGLTFLAYEFESSFIPTKSIVWTYTTQKQWVHKIEKEIIS